MTAALRIESLTKRYGSTVAVRDLDLTVGTGQVYGLLGPNGSGKTTTLRCALGLLRPDAGRIRVLGTPAAALHRTRGRVGVVFDESTLVPGLTVHANLGWARRLLGHDGGRTAEEALALAGLADRGGQRARSLSLGQKRRLAIARALLGRPELLVLDEPLSGLDTPGVRSVLDLVLRLRDEGITLLLSSHRLHEVERVVSHVGIVLGGRLVREESLDALLGDETPRLVLRTTRPDTAREVLHALRPGAAVPHGEVAPDGSLEFRVAPGDVPAAVVNRRLVEAGCEVSSLAPARRSLQAVFEDLLDAQLDAAGAPGGGGP